MDESHKWVILNNSYAIPRDNQQFISSLEKGLDVASSSELHARLEAELLYRDEVAVLPEVAQLLLTNAVSKTERERLLYSIANGITSEKAVSQLVILLGAADPSLHPPAAEGLWHIASSAATGALCRALEDPNPQVRYYVIRALADIERQPEWGPSIPEFEQNGSKYLRHWLEWARLRGL